MKYLLVLGYGWSGSSAVVDLLKEYQGTKDVPIEFRLIKDPKGLMDLRYNIVDRWDPLNIDIAIRDFLWHTKYLNQNISRFHFHYGLEYGSVLGSKFEEETNNFINKITKLTYSSYWFYFNYEPGLKYFTKKLLRKLRISKLEKEMYYCNIDGEQFDTYCKDYINSIFSDYCGDNLLILDQSIPAQYLSEASHYFDDYKMILVDRDPRDIYCDLIKCNGLIGQELKKTDNVGLFVDWFLGFRKKNKTFKSDKLLRVSFEELVNNYDETVKTIETFVGFNDSLHVDKKHFFDPEKSKQNVGLWKDYANQDAMSEIAKCLPHYIKSN